MPVKLSQPTRGIIMASITCNKGHQNVAESRFCYRCGESLLELNANTTSLKPSLLPGTRLRDRYIIQQQLGQGGFGSTYLAEDTGRFNEVIALKELTPVNQETYALQKAEELFQQEALILCKLQHPQIPRFREFFREGKRLFLVQDFIDGETYESLLSQRIQKGQCFSEIEVLEFLRQLLPVLSYLHRQGIIHRDISPDNIICRVRDGLPVLIDLGGVKQIAVEVATLAGSQNSAVIPTGTRLGKVGYAPDEQLRLGIVAPHSDLYALGVTSIVLMTGKQPQQLIDPYTMYWLWKEQLNLSQQLSGVLNRMLATQPVERFQSADELLQHLEADLSESKTLLLNHSVRNPAVNANQSYTPANNSGQGGILKNSVKVPAEIQGWNWGAFLLPGFWCLTNQVWIGLIAWLDLSLITFGLAWPIMGIILGIKGNEWAWKSRNWRSVTGFKRHQRAWTVVGFFVLTVILLLVLLLLIFLIFVFGKVSVESLRGMSGKK